MNTFTPIIVALPLSFVGCNDSVTEVDQDSSVSPDTPQLTNTHRKTAKNNGMKYQLTISRGAQWQDEESFIPIAEAEWERFVSTSKNYIKITELLGKNPQTGEVLKINLPNSVEHKELNFLLSFSDGVIDCMYAEELLPHYKKVAEYFNASIYGEEGETY